MFVVVAYLAGITLFPIWLLKKRFEEVLPLVLMGSVLVLYIFGFFNMLAEGVFVLSGWACASALFVLWKSRHSMQGLAARFVTPGLLVFAAGVVYMYIMFHSGTLLYEWDELAYWGPAAKQLYHAGGFWGNLQDMHAEVPPASTLFQYLWMKLLGGFHEEHLLLSLHTLCFSTLLPTLKCAQWRDLLLWAPTGLLMFVLPGIAFPSYMSNIYPDALMALTFAYLMYRVFTLNQSNALGYIAMSVAAAFLVLVKGSGILLALIAMASLAVRLLVANRPRFRRIKENLRGRWKYVLGFVLCMLLPVACAVSWAMLSSPAQSGIGQLIQPKAIGAFITGGAQSRSYGIAEAFFSNLFTSTDSDARVAFSYVGWMALLWGILFGFILIRYRRRERSTAIAVNICMLVGGCLYAMCVLLLYLFGSLEYPELLPSYYRLMNTYTLAYLAFGFLAATEMFGKLLPRKARVRAAIYLPISCLLVLAFIFMLPGNYHEALAMGNDPCDRKAYRQHLHAEATRLVNRVDAENDRVFIVLQNTHGYEYHSFLFDTMPLQINPPYSWSIGEPYPPSCSGGEENWTWAIDADEFLAHLRDEDYEYVYLAHIDDQFIRQFGHAFQGGGELDDGALYTVNHSDGGIVLSPVKF